MEQTSSELLHKHEKRQIINIKELHTEVYFHVPGETACAHLYFFAFVKIGLKVVNK